MTHRVETQHADNLELHQDSQSACGDSDSKLDDMKVDTHGAPASVVNLKLELISESKEQPCHIHNPTDSSHKVAEPKFQNTTFKDILETKESVSGSNKFPQNKIPVRCLKGHYNQSDAILLGTPKLLISSESAREALSVLYAFFHTMEPNLSFIPCINELRCFGYFTHDFDTCSFVAQI